MPRSSATVSALGWLRQLLSADQEESCCGAMRTSQDANHHTWARQRHLPHSHTHTLRSPARLEVLLPLTCGNLTASQPNLASPLQPPHPAPAPAVVDGELSHADSMGNREALPRGCVQYMSAGTGVSHSVRRQHRTQCSVTWTVVAAKWCCTSLISLCAPLLHHTRTVCYAGCEGDRQAGDRCGHNTCWRVPRATSCAVLEYRCIAPRCVPHSPTP